MSRDDIQVAKGFLFIFFVLAVFFGVLSVSVMWAFLWVAAVCGTLLLGLALNGNN